MKAGSKTKVKAISQDQLQKARHLANTVRLMEYEKLMVKNRGKRLITIPVNDGEFAALAMAAEIHECGDLVTYIKDVALNLANQDVLELAADLSKGKARLTVTKGGTR